MSRHIGFIGFKTEEEAKEAQTFFDNSFLDTSKLRVEMAAAVSGLFANLMDRRAM